MPRAVLDLRLYLVTDSWMCHELGVPATVAAAVRGGVTAVQLRDPHCPDDDFVHLGRAVAAQLAGTGVRLLLNDRVHLVAASGADGAHIGQADLDVAAAREILGPQRYLGLSVQTLAQAEAAALVDPGLHLIDYLGVGPVWAQSTKPDAAAPGGPHLLAAICAAAGRPCVAIGGIDAARVAAVRAAGAGGVAVVSAICGQPDPGSAARSLRAAWGCGDSAQRGDSSGDTPSEVPQSPERPQSEEGAQ